MTVTMRFEQSLHVTGELFEHFVNSHKLGHDGFHGKAHWLGVLRNGRDIAATTGANLRVVELFSVLHDSLRLNESQDLAQGFRAVGYARALRRNWLEADSAEMALLIAACLHHSAGQTKADQTVQVYWDADWIFLGRMGIRYDERYIFTLYAKRFDVSDQAYLQSIYGVANVTERNREQHLPRFISLAYEGSRFLWGVNEWPEGLY